MAEGTLWNKPAGNVRRKFNAKNLICCLVLVVALVPTINALSEDQNESANERSVLENDNINIISKVDNNLDEDDSYLGTLHKWYKLVRNRRELCWWGFCPSDEAETTTATTAATTSFSEANSELIDIDENEAHKRMARSTTFSDGDVTPARAPTNLVDDDDYETPYDFSGDRLQGSGEDGVTPPVTYTTSLNIPGTAQFFRITMKLHEPFREEFTNKSSPVYHDFELTVVEAFDKLLKGLPGRQSVRLVAVRKIPEDTFFLQITVDIETLDYYNEEEITGRIRRHVSENNRLGPYTVAGDFAIRAFGAGRTQCSAGETLCRSGECFDASQRCDGFRDCKDGSDEVGCSVTPNPISSQPSLDKCRGDDKVRCPDGSELICEDQICDGSPDCSSGWDESNCTYSDCRDDEFLCDVSRCLPLSAKCDENYDCVDKMDEMGCFPLCKENEFRCRDDKCIGYFQHCNGVRDCVDGSDEVDCACPSGIICDNQTCVEYLKVCDGVNDCEFGEDEENCMNKTTSTTEPTVCQPDQWLCRDGHCIDSRLRCNGRRDCPNSNDDSDERDCSSSTGCSGSQFDCKNGKCIDGNLRCDKKQDCSNNADEMGCPCSVIEDFECVNISNYCIPMSLRCDGYNDCQDGSDEIGCSVRECQPWEFRCADLSACIAKSQRCDRRRDCNDRSDEENCPNEECTAQQFQCRDGKCIGIWQRCNMVSDCSGGEDENNCGSCADTEFQCKDGKCLNGNQRCDGKNDCSDGADEMSCGPCSDSDFACDDDLCVPLKFRCDGTAQCDDGSDEVNCPRVESTVRPACGNDQFTCAGGECISSIYVCDSIPDCTDKSDELSCPVCGADDVVCGDGRCISASRKCDLYLDCYDGSDEFGCGICSPGDFHCQDGSCVLEQKRCDGQPDCRDGSDELNCVSLCGSQEWRCRNGLCLANSRRCNGRRDCPDGSDEEECPTTQCLEARCSDNTCMPFRHICDGFPDCSDGSDENNCSRSLPSQPCRSGEFPCNDGSCIQQSRVCDRVTDCPNGRDEEQCSPETCKPSEFKCTDQLQCIDNSLRCDRRVDCVDGSDERHCGCGFNEFACNSGECIAKHKTCDDIRDCQDGSDELNCAKTPAPAPQRCRPGEFSCFSGDECVSQAFHCDGRPDCRDQSDEINCDAEACRPGYFRCENGPCIPGELRCNGANDCPLDMSDELDCRPGAPRNLNLVTVPKEQTIKEGREVVFQCRDEGLYRAAVRWSRSDGQPLPPGSRDRNGRLEIPNVQLNAEGSYSCEAIGYPKSTPGQNTAVFLKVESAPTALPPRRQVCGLDEATCNNWECIKKSQICDGTPDCRDGSDEVRCVSRGSCEPNQFKCLGGQCVRKDWLCDGQVDCMDGEDEANCQVATETTCAESEFQCESKTLCLPRYMHCDGEIDCQDASDEKQCSKPIFVETPPALITLDCRTTNILKIACTAIGGPVPVVSWRRNWGHIPSNCKQTCVNGVSQLVCIDIRESEQGAYSCEAYNSKGHIFASPDTQVLCLEHQPGGPCPSGTFNEDAVRRDECVNCFCSGKSSRCSSSDLFTYQLLPPLSQYRIIGVSVAPDGSVVDIRASTALRTSSSSRAFPSGFQVYSRSQVERPDFTGSVLPYFVLPDVFTRSQLKSYGGYLKYNLRFGGNGRQIQGPDVVIRGNNVTLSYTVPQHTAGQEQNIRIQFWPKIWIKQGRRGEETPASREDILTVLADVQYFLLRAQYVDGEIIDTTVSEVSLDSAGTQNIGAGRATFVEKCECPVGYQGLSCEECSPGFSRVAGQDPLNGECRRDVEISCPVGYYGNPARNIPCQPCPCPLTNPSNQFTSRCYLASDGQVTCECPQGYAGRRCETCDRGYTGNPNRPGDSCRPASSCSIAGSLTPEPNQTGECSCKDMVTGSTCDRCKAGSFLLNERNPSGCIGCFCSGVTRSCDSSLWYRDQVTAAFVRDANNFKLTEADSGRMIDNAVHVDTQSRELVYQDFSPGSPQAYYWSLPLAFLGNKLTSYGGFLKYTIRYVPTPGGASSRNTNADVQLVSANDLNIKLFYYHRGEASEPNRPQTIEVPLREQFWQRHDGQAANREHLLMALSDLSQILIKATYTTNTKEAAIVSVSLDTAVERNTGQSRALEVEQCVCPPGYRGLSCEDCDFGYTRTGEGLYLGTCEPCSCNNHSSECDPEFGTCLNCRHGTTGDSCDECLPGYSGNPTSSGCVAHSEEPCRCNPRGSLGSYCPNGQCQCRPNVDGANCDRCAYGFFGLEELGQCLRCFCSDLSQDCQSSRHLTKLPIPIIILNNNLNHGFTITDNTRLRTFRTGFELNDAKNEITYQVSGEGPALYWSLPPTFTGNRVLSYGGVLTLSQRFQTSGFGRPTPKPDVDVILTGNGITLYWRNPSQLSADSLNTYNVTIAEGSSWTRLDPSGPRTAARSDILTVLANLESVQIYATPFEDISSTSLSDVALDSAIDRKLAGGDLAYAVEYCRCPVGYRGTSCESCASGYYRDSFDRSTPSAFGLCKKCPCGDREESCVLEGNGRVLCSCKAGYTGRNCETEGPLRPDNATRPTPPPPRISISIAEPTIQIMQSGSTVRFKCAGRSLEAGRPVTIGWRKEAGELPAGRSVDDARGILVITSVQQSDSGTYICSVSDGISIATHHSTLVVKGEEDSRPPPSSVPIVEVAPEFSEVREGEPVEFVCRARFGQPSTLTWTHIDGAPLNPQGRFQNGVFSIPRARKSDEGRYVCTAENQFGKDASYVQLIVKTNTYPPDSGIPVSVEPPEYNGPETDVLVFTCHPQNYNLVWERQDGSSLPRSASQQNGILTFYNPIPSDSGLYYCKASDSFAGLSGSNYVRVNINPTAAAPSVQIDPEEQTVFQGLSTELRCLYRNHANAHVRWSRLGDESLPQGATAEGSVLRFQRLLPLDRGTYVCTVDTPQGSSQAMARLEVEPRESPTIQIHPEAFNTITEGRELLIQCLITGGIPTPKLRWTQLNGSPIQSSSAKEEENGVLRINRVSVADSGSYVCVADNDVGSISATATVDVLVPPTVNLTPSDTTTVAENDRMRLECRASGKPTPVVSWMRFTINHVRKVYETQNITEEQPLSVVYSVSSVTENDEGTYVCVARNSAGSTQERVTVYIDRNAVPNRGDIPGGGETPPPPEQPTPSQPYNYVTPIGGRTQMRCSVQQRNDIHLEWHRADSRQLPPTGHVQDGVLYIDNTQIADGGEYYCVGISDNQILFRTSATLSVFSPPRITLEPARQVVRLGDHANIICSATGDDPLTIVWTAVGRSLPANAIARDGYLTFRSISVDDEGKYLCTAKNEFGAADAVAEVLVLPSSFHTTVLAENHEQSATIGSSIQLRCNVSTDRGGRQPQVQWSRVGAELPPNSQAVGEVLRLSRVSLADSGRYICEIVTPSGERSSDYIQLRVDREPCGPNDFRCIYNGHCIPFGKYCDGNYDCLDGSDEQNCRKGRGVAPVVVSIQPSLPKVRAGDDLTVKCVAAGGGSNAIVAWNRVGQELDGNAQIIRDVLRFNKVQDQNGGKYRCTADTDKGSFSEDYVLAIDAPVMNIPPTAEIKKAPYRKTVELQCKTDLERTVSYSWSKLGGSLPRDSFTKDSMLVINEVLAQDAGSYICEASNALLKITVPVILVVTGVVPFFPQTPVSYMMFPSLPDSTLKFKFDLSFKPESPNGLILFNGDRRSNDFVSLGLTNSFVEFQFDVGSGPVVIKNDRPVRLGQWHTVNVTRALKTGSMVVDDSEPFEGHTPGAFTSLDLSEPLYIGGVPDFGKSHGYVKGMVGCVSRLNINGMEHDLVGHAISKKDVTTCETCVNNPCQNRGVCQEGATREGYTCLCPSGFGGQNCDSAGETCYAGACGSGKCVNKNNGFSCSCPMGLTGEQCEEKIAISTPKFSGDSFLAFSPIKTSRRIRASVMFTPSTNDDGLILYAANPSSQQFMAVLMKDNRIEYRFDVGNGLQTLRSRIEIAPGETVTIVASRVPAQAELTIKQEKGKPDVSKTSVFSSSKIINYVTPLYVGGHDDYNQLTGAVGATQGFHGCISFVEILGETIFPGQSPISSSNILNCPDRKRYPCETSPCRNGGQCVPAGQGYECACTAGYSGRHCQRESNLCETLQPCRNNGTCKGTSSTYKCTCPFGFSGATCATKLDLSRSVSFKSDGYLELPNHFVTGENGRSNIIVVDFVADGPDGVILWQGDGANDFLAVGVTDWHLVFSYNLGTGIGRTVSQQRLVTGKVHKAILKRKGREATVQLDDDYTFGRSEGENMELNVAQNIFVGGVPDYASMTNNLFYKGFDGCIVSLELHESGHINFSQQVRSFQNVHQCSNRDDDVDNEIGEDAVN